jgi:hypothetical protein
MIDLVIEGQEALTDGRPADALRIFERLGDSHPSELGYQYAVAMMRLYVGDYPRAFREMENRYQAMGFDNPIIRRIFLHGVERWRGEPGRLVLLHDWGLGDTIMMLRYVPQLSASNTVTLLMPSPLVSLAKQFGCEVRDSVGKVEFDFYLPIMSLPTVIEEIPPAPYLIVGEELKQHWRQPAGRHLGIAWCGDPNHARDATRSISLSEFIKLLPPGYTLHCLQTGDQIEALIHGVKVHPFDDFADVAALMASMDKLIMVDTACANLAGAIGHPDAHVLLDYACDWRWHRAKDWYPTLHVHKQTKRNDWSSIQCPAMASQKAGTALIAD